jgi:hypothetical protein
MPALVAQRVPKSSSNAFAGPRLAHIDTVVYKNRWLELAKHFHRCHTVFRRKAIRNIKPYSQHRSIIFDKFPRLILKIFAIPPQVRVWIINCSAATGFGIIPVVPVACGIIKPQFDPIFLTGVLEFFNDVTFERAGCYIIISIFAGSHTKPRVMFGGKDNIFHARLFGDFHPFFGIELLGIKLLV